LISGISALKTFEKKLHPFVSGVPALAGKKILKTSGGKRRRTRGR